MKKYLLVFSMAVSIFIPHASLSAKAATVKLCCSADCKMKLADVKKRLHEASARFDRSSRLYHVERGIRVISHIDLNCDGEKSCPTCPKICDFNFQSLVRAVNDLKAKVKMNVSGSLDPAVKKYADRRIKDALDYVDLLMRDCFQGA